MRIRLIGNYAPDVQESMLRYSSMLRDGLEDAGHDVEIVAPRPVLNVMTGFGSVARKWLGNADKYLFAPLALRRSVGSADIVHVCDHSNAVYVPHRSTTPYVVTCHDLIAVRAGLGEDADYRPSVAGRYLQRAILEGLGRARAVACVSGATRSDFTRLLGEYRGELALVPNALNHPYRRLDARDARERLAALPTLAADRPFVLVLGSNERRKNRDAAVRTLAAIRESWDGVFVIAGEPLTPALWRLATQLDVQSRIVEVVKPGNDLLEALYGSALALLFPSRFEGFGWPVIEAQACGCAVLCSDRAPLPEVAGSGALFFPPDDHRSFGAAIVALQRDPRSRDELVQRGLENSRRFRRPAMIDSLVELYRRVLRTD